ncbi:hypothetical protein [Microbacterium sp. SLBN-146]|uniref:hypothetical protein n=1 Tax=Microbacterium sp. SLBN-146 TaxID=2768457 RepID=UPI0011527D21|nr:hypothetical protein [Microbacterium sp. SLBN-146]TQJ30620.1 hypothetical protein FBY39_1073 [Microbacterium sp. SLBN-146]
MGHRRALSPLAVLAAAALLAGPAATAYATPAVPAPTVVFAGAPADEETPTPAPTDSTTWAIAPGGADGPDGRVSLRHRLDPGATVADQVVVTNFSARPALFRIYASDGVVTDDGNFDLIPAEEAPTDGGSWITLGPLADLTPEESGGYQVEIPAGGTLTVPVQISVPADASPGDHPAGIVAELLQAGDSPVQFTTRVGVRAHLRVTGEVVANVTPENFTTTFHPNWNPFAPGTLEVTYDLANNGNVRLGATTSTDVTALFDIALAGATGEAREILPRQSTSVTETFTVWPVFMTFGEVTATPTIVGSDDPVTTELTPTTTSFTAWTIPWSQLVILVILAALITFIVWSRKRSESRTQAKIDAAVAAATAASVVGAGAASTTDAGTTAASAASVAGAEAAVAAEEAAATRDAVAAQEPPQAEEPAASEEPAQAEEPVASEEPNRS